MRTFPRVSPGQPLAVPAEEWNAILAASEHTLGHGFRPSLGDLAGQRSAGVCQIDNQCGAARAANDILGISGPAITPTQDEELFSLDVPILAGIEPAAAHVGAFAVLAEPAEAGAIALGIVTGVAAVRVHVTDADHASAELEAAEYDHLASADNGSAAILWKEAGTGVLWAIVRLGNVDQRPLLLGMPTGAYTSGATITLDPCDAAGVDNGQPNATVQAGWTLPANTNIPTTAIIPYQLAADGNFYVIGQPREVITNMQYDTTTHKLQKKVRYDFGAFATTESSAWVDITTAVDCTAV